jgi:hypothetical protein
VVQLDPIKPTLKAPASKSLILSHDKLLSNVGFTFKLRHYSVVVMPRCATGEHDCGAATGCSNVPCAVRSALDAATAADADTAFVDSAPPVIKLVGGGDRIDVPYSVGRCRLTLSNPP